MVWGWIFMLRSTAIAAVWKWKFFFYFNKKTFSCSAAEESFRKMAKIEKGWKADAVEKYCIRINKRRAKRQAVKKKTMVMCWYSEVNWAFPQPLTFRHLTHTPEHHTHYLLCAKLFISFRSLYAKESSNPFLLSREISPTTFTVYT